MTMVMSLIVVPARADYTENATGSITVSANKNPANEGDEVQFSVSAPTISYNGQNYNARITSYKWNNDNDQTGETYTTTAGSNNLTASCTVELSYTIPASGEGVGAVAAQTITASATNSATVQVQSNADAFKAAITTITYNGRRCVKNGDSVTYYTFTHDVATDPVWSAQASNGYEVTDATLSSDTLTIKGRKGQQNVNTTFTAVATPATLQISGNPSDGRVISGGSIRLTATATGFTFPLNPPTYAWTVDGNTVTTYDNTYEVSGLTNITSNETTKVITCTASVQTGSSESPSTLSVETTYTVTIVPGTCTLEISSVPAASYNTISLSTIGSSAVITATLKDSAGQAVDNAKVGYGWYTSGNTNGSYSISGTSTRTLTATLNTSGTITITPYANYMGRTFYATPREIRVTSSVIEATLASVQSGGTATYSYLDFVNAAQTALNKVYTAANYQTITSLSNVTQVASTVYYGTGTGANTIYYNNGSGQGTLYFTAKSVFGTAQYTAYVTAKTSGGSSQTYTVTFSIPVSPAKVTYEDQYPTPVAYGNTYRYYVQVPSGYSSYYVLGTPNQATEPNWTLTGTQYYGSALYYLTDANFVGGKCTLWLVTRTSGGAYYCGLLTVYQKNYNINYNGVAGETVQFAQSDFNDFMNKVAEARGDASKTKSYPYVTFDYVTFSLPTTAQGTLYYGGTAMSTSNSSGAFNTRTKVTNLDSVTFVPNAKSTAKTITLNFTLYATRYSSSSTSRGTTVSYSGSVVVNLVREDIKYTVSQGDSVRFDESDFLSYLRSTKGYSSNYTIDYVTFDQSAVSAVNEGSLYTYYNGYNYGGSIKTTDKFYYNATASQNAISDVAFLASRYAKTGETVYIPFTIYARYGTTGTGTRQLTGTVAIKIGQTMNFIDVKTTDYFYNSVKWAVGKNITNGTSSTTFSPYKSCTRAEIVTFLWRAAGSPEPTTTRNPFRDVNAVTHSSYYKAILWASQKGITSGTSTTAFSPDQVCTRAQIVTFLYRYAGQPSGYYSNPFKDVGATSEASYYKAILWAVGKGITTGTSATTFSPYASCNRAEAVTFLYRYTNGL